MKYLSLLFFINFICLSQTTISSEIRGRDCIGGIGLCGGVETVIQKKTSGDNIYNNSFYLILNQDKLTKNEILKTQDKTIKTLWFDVSKDIILDDLTIKENNLDPSKPLIKAGLYPIVKNENELKVHFSLSEILKND